MKVPGSHGAGPAARMPWLWPPALSQQKAPAQLTHAFPRRPRHRRPGLTRVHSRAHPYLSSMADVGLRRWPGPTCRPPPPPQPDATTCAHGLRATPRGGHSELARGHRQARETELHRVRAETTCARRSVSTAAPGSQLPSGLWQALEAGSPWQVLTENYVNTPSYSKRKMAVSSQV